MKLNFLLSIALMCIISSAKAQNTTFNNVLIGTDLPAGGVTMKMNFPGLTGAWSRSFYVSNENNTEKYIGFGAYGTAVNGVTSFTNAYIGKDWNARFMTFLANGNIGIGTSVPTANLEIAATSLVGAETVLKVRVSDATQDYFRITNATNGDLQFIPALYGYHVSDNRSALYLTAAIELGNDSGTDPVMTFDSRLSANAVTTRTLFAWDSYGNRKMLLTANGSLGIGTTTTGPHKLAVEGSIGAREIKVQATGWSDFVFEKNYSLPTLEEVEKHINEKGHLKDIPSEKEVLENGINLGEMNSKLLQKIEELTLYSIEQNKKIEVQAKEIESLKNLVLRVTKIESELARK